MAETDLSDKQRIMDRIRENVQVFTRVSSNQYRIRCPLCGDSQKDPRKSRLYLKCSNDPSEPILYNCFNCSARGVVNHHFFDKLGVSASGLVGLESRKYNKLISLRTDTAVMTGAPIVPSPQSEYISYRLGEGLTVEDLDRFKIIWDFELVKPFIEDRRVLNTLPSNHDSISFVSDDKSVLLTRFFADDGQSRWKKVRLFKSESKSIYTVKSTMDLMGADRICVNIGEGIFDVISIYKNFNTGDNSVYLGCLGNDYRSGLDHVVAMGIFGTHVNVRIYADSDVDRQELKARFRSYRWLFGSITLLWNTRAHDFGVIPENLAPVEINV